MNVLIFIICFAVILTILLARAGLKSTGSALVKNPLGRPTRVLIVGATGGTGRELVKQALNDGYLVTALVRNPQKLQLTHPQLTIVQGDVLDYPSVETTMSNQEAVISALGHKRFYYLPPAFFPGEPKIWCRRCGPGASRG